MSTARTHARNLAANWFGTIIGLMAVFFLSPFVVHTLGKTEYGIWGLLNVFTGYLGIFDLGVRMSLGRFIILYVGRQDHEGVNGTLKTGLGFFSLVGIAIMPLAIGAGFLFPVFFPTVPAAYHNEIRILLPLLVLNIYLSAVSGGLTSILAAHDRFDLQQVVDISVLAVRTGATVVVLLAGYGIVGLTIVAVGASALSVMGNRWMAGRAYPHLKVWPLSISRERLRELFGFGIPLFISTVASKLVGQTDLVVVGMLFDMKAVAIYSVGATLVWYTGPLFGQIEGILFPSIQRSVATGDTDSVRWTYIRLWKAMLAFGLLLYLGFIFFGEAFIRLWMGPDFAQGHAIMVVLSAGRLIGLMAGGAGTVLYAQGRVWFLTVLSVAGCVLTLLLSLAFAGWLKWGLPGVAAGGPVVVLISFWICPWLAHPRIGLTFRALLAPVILPGIIVAAAFSGWCYLVRLLVPGNTWGFFAAQVGLAVAGYVPIALFTLVPLHDRKRIFKFLRISPAEAGTA